MIVNKVKVIENEVKVIEKEVRVIENVVKVIENEVKVIKREVIMVENVVREIENEKRFPLYLTCGILFFSHLEKRVWERWLSLRGHSCQDCVRIYLTVGRKWQFFGAKLFSARVKHSSSGAVDPATVTHAWLAVQEDSVSVLDFTNLVRHA